MPHECTNCGTEYEDGSEEILSGCSECGGAKFQYISSQSPPPELETKNQESKELRESNAQKEARSVTVSENELPSSSSFDSVDNVSTTSKVQEELNRQFENITIISKGKYEINLQGLFEKGDCVISLQEDGKYVIHFSNSK